MSLVVLLRIVLLQVLVPFVPVLPLLLMLILDMMGSSANPIAFAIAVAATSNNVMIKCWSWCSSKITSLKSNFYFQQKKLQAYFQMVILDGTVSH